tara:strand:- start:31580 stop:32722 length:1143 start_codon:yes stop_codon:yes gene_type:complete
MQWNIQEIPVKELSTGEVLSIKTYTLKGNKPGPHVHIQASVHGAEIQGNAVILKLMEKLKGLELTGSLTLIPLANPYATLNKHGTYTYGRYNPVTGHNWNRNYIDIIKTCKINLEDFVNQHLNSPLELIISEYKSFIKNALDLYTSSLASSNTLQDNNRINLILQGLSVTADGILDLHTGPTATRYLYAAEYEEKIAHIMLFKNILVIPNDFDGAMDEASFMPWIHLKHAFKDKGKDIDFPIESFTLEFGSEETFQMDRGEKDVQSIINYLRYKKMLSKESVGEIEKLDQVFYSKLENYKTIYSPLGGLVDFHLAPGDHFKKDDLLAVIYQMKKIDPNNPLKSCATEVRALGDGIVINRCPSSNVHQGMELFQVMLNVYQ